MIVAHRGASKEAPENTLEAFRLAWLQNADAIEGDFRLTKDNQIVCMHDEDTERTCGKKLIVSESSYAELSSLDTSFQFDNIPSHSIPLLADVIKTIPENKVIYIEVKCGPEIVPALITTILNSNLNKEQISIISFDSDVIKAFKAIVPNIKANWLYDVASPVANNDLLDCLNNIKADGLGSNNIHSKKLVDIIVQAGFEYHSWTVDDIAIAKKLLQWGSASITTNRPGYLKQQLFRKQV